MVNLTKEQEAILAEHESSIRVLAAAGSGKTTTMAYYVKEAIVNRKIKEDEIMFWTFTKFAAKQIKNKVHSVMNKSKTSIFYGTFHSVVFKMLTKAGYNKIDSNTLYSQRFDEFIKLFINLLKERDIRILQQIQKLKLLIIDEFQDLDADQFEFIKIVKNIIPHIRIIAIGDLAQNIYAFRGTSNEFLNQRLQKDICPDLKSFKLTTNFRSTPLILNFINALFAPEIKEGYVLPMKAPETKEKGVKPRYYEFAKNPEAGGGDYEDNVANELYNILLESKKLKKSVCLVFPKMKCHSYEFILALIRNKCEKDGFPFDIHKIAKEDETCATIEFQYEEGKDEPVQTSTFHSSKGLEWDVVCVINVSDSMYNVGEFEEDNESFMIEKTNLLYVAVSRAAKELILFGNANDGGQHRFISRMGESIHQYCDVIIWGKECKEYNGNSQTVIGIVELIRRLPQQKDLFERVIKCSENIPYTTKEGISFFIPHIYDEMKMRNRELAFGTYIDWKLKNELCYGNTKTIQEAFLELQSLVSSYNWFHKNEAIDPIELLEAKLHMHFLNMEKEPSRSLKAYLGAARWLAKHSSRKYKLVKNLKEIWIQTEKKLLKTMMKKEKSAIDEYLISQSLNFFMKGRKSEIDAITAPTDSYQGLPEGFEEFIDDVIQPCLKSMECLLEEVGLQKKPIYGDIHLETESLIVGEADMVIMDELLIEIKCGTAKTSADLRDIGNCKHILQVLSYVALGRHGTLPMKVKKAVIINPITGAWEIYDIEKWSHEDSFEFLTCLEELKVRM